MKAFLFLILLAGYCSSSRAATISLEVAYFDRNPAMQRTTVVQNRQTGDYAAMVGREVSLTRGIDPLVGPLHPTDPNYFAELRATVSPTRLKIYTRASLANMPLGAFPTPPNYFGPIREFSNQTGFAFAELRDTLTILSDTETEGQLRVQFEASGRGVVAGGATARAMICPSVIVSTPVGCTPSGVEVGTGNFLARWTYVFNVPFNRPFVFRSDFYTTTLIQEPTGPPETRYNTGATVDALRSLSIVNVAITNQAGEALSARTLLSSSGIDYFNLPANEEDKAAIPEPGTTLLFATATALLLIRRDAGAGGA